MDEALMEAVTKAVENKKFLKIQYRTDLNEFLTVTSMIKRMEEKEGELNLELVTGQEIKFEDLVKVGDVPSNKFTPRDFTCDC